MIDTTAPDANLTWEIVGHLNEEIAREKCRGCNWQNIDTCRACNEGQRTIVLAVNKRGIVR